MTRTNWWKNAMISFPIELFQLNVSGVMIHVCSRSATTTTVRHSLYNNPTVGIRYLPAQHQTRTFFDSILKSGLGDCPLRNLTHTKIIPYSSSATFKAVADVSGYPAFLPFTISSHVTSRDSNGYPTRAKLRIGYEKFGIEENWDSIVLCDPERGLIEARSSEKGSSGLFEVLKTKWHIQESGKKQTSVKLDVNVKFRNVVYDQMFAQVEGKVAGAMISAFEKKVQEVEASQ